MADYAIQVTTRSDQGKGASRRLRRLAAQVPAIVYGGNKDPQAISVPHKELVKALEDEGFYTHVIELDIEGTTEQVLLKDLQRHPSRPLIMHADFLRVDAATKVTMKVPVHFINEDTCVGVKQQGGMIQRSINELEVRCLTKDLPDFFEVDMANVELGQIIHISDMKIPANVEVLELIHGAGHDQAVVSVIAPRGGAAAEEGDEGTAEAE